MKVVNKVLRAIAVAGLISLPYSAAHAWGGGPWGGGDNWGSDWGPFDGDGWGDMDFNMSGGWGGYPGGGYGGGYPGGGWGGPGW